METNTSEKICKIDRIEPNIHLDSDEIQSIDTVIPNVPIGLDAKVRKEVVAHLNQVLADSLILRDLYKKSHWQVSGVTFYQLHLLFDKHYGEQVDIIDEIAERIQVLGGVSVAMGADVAFLTRIPKAPQGRETPAAQISRLLEAHELLIKEARDLARSVNELGDDGSNDLLISTVLRTNELQAWFLYEHLVKAPLVGGTHETEARKPEDEQEQDMENGYYDSPTKKNIQSLNKSH